MSGADHLMPASMKIYSLWSNFQDSPEVAIAAIIQIEALSYRSHVRFHTWKHCQHRVTAGSRPNDVIEDDNEILTEKSRKYLANLQFGSSRGKSRSLKGMLQLLLHIKV
jgi:hypothetical protein